MGRESDRRPFDYRAAAINKIFIILGLILVVSFVVYMTPMPEEYFESCDRPCHELDWPMICRVKLTLEVYKSLSRSCKECPGNSSDCESEYCVGADGFSRGILAANRRLPGPSIQVCQNDIMVIDVVNRIPGQGVTFHWRGQPQTETPFMDGVPMVTQCPIPSYTTFQYKFRAEAPGTHLYHAHSGAEIADGLFGALVVRQPDRLEPHRKLYDIDDAEHVVVVSEWSHGFAIRSVLDSGPLSSEALLVNGRSGASVPPSVFRVDPGKRHRFRVAHGGGVVGCPIKFEVEGHELLLIALDGRPIVAEEVRSFVLGRGERADFVLWANRASRTYAIYVSSVGSCGRAVHGVALLEYESKGAAVTENNTPSSIPAEINSLAGSECSRDDILCITEMKPLKEMPEPLREEHMQTVIYLPFQREKRDNQRNAGSGEVDGVSFTFPSSPLLTQDLEEGEEKIICDRDACRHPHKCECVNLHRIPLENTVELVLIDTGGGEGDAVFHLHGYSFYVVAANRFAEPLKREDVEKMHKEGTLFPKKAKEGVEKDTISVPKNGAVALRFKADNPGMWILRDEHSDQWTRGLDVLLQVGDRSQFVRAPSDFPKCGSYVGPHYMLV